jgi:hypothetical protein
MGVLDIDKVACAGFIKTAMSILDEKTRPAILKYLQQNNTALQYAGLNVQKLGIMIRKSRPAARIPGRYACGINPDKNEGMINVAAPLASTI